jgi:hypothetical protein
VTSPQNPDWLIRLDSQRFPDFLPFRATRFSFFARLGKCTSYPLRVKVFAVNRRSGLLTPGFIQSASIDPVESEFIDELQDDVFGLVALACRRFLLRR